MKKALFLIGDGFEDLQYFVPYYRLREIGLSVVTSALVEGVVMGRHGYRAESEISFNDLAANDFDILILPGGSAPENLRLEEEAVSIARYFVQENLIVGAIGHGVQLLISAGALVERTVTSSPSIRDDVRHADATYRDELVVVDENLITARGNEGLAAFSAELIKRISKLAS